MAQRTSDFTVYIVHDPKANETTRVTDKDEAYRLWCELEGAQCDAYNSAEHWSYSLDAEFEDWRDEEDAQAFAVARHHQRLALGARLAS